MRFIVMHLENLDKMVLRQKLAGFGPLALPAVLSAAMAGAALAASPGKEMGTWFDDTGDGAIKIEACGDNLCGKIVWLKDPLNDKGQPLHDAHNPEARLRTRTICGLPLLGDLARQEDGSYDSGWVYDPKEGKSYSFSLKLVASDRLQVTGYLGMKLLGRSMIWSRAPANLPSCTGTPPPVEAQKAPPAAVAPAAKAATAAPAQPAAPATAAPAKAAPAGKAPPPPSKAVGEKLPWAAKPAAPAP